MGLVTDVYWKCPNCETKNQAQIYGDWEDPKEFPRKAVPIGRELKWNPPCTECGKYRLVNPKGIIELPIERIIEEE